MDAFDEHLRSLLEAEGNRVAPDPARRGAAVARVGRRRAVRTWGAGAFAVAVALAAFSGGGTIVSVFDRNGEAQPAGNPSSSYSVLGTGTHEGRDWVLSVGTGASGREEVVFEIEGRYPGRGAFETHADWTRIEASYQDSIAGAGDYVMGMVERDAASVTLVLDGEQVEARVFGDGGVRFFLAFVPADANGVAIARSEAGEILGSSRLSRGSIDFSCPRDYTTEDELGDDRFPVLGGGTFEGRRWIVSLIEDPDAAHPEDTESDNPELAFEIEGLWPNGGTIETHGGWDGVSEPFYDGLSGDDAYAFGMASAQAVSVTVEPDEGDPVEADLLDARDVPSPGAQVYVAFVPAGTTGDVVARDAAGAVIGREPLRAPPDVSFCE